MKPETSRKLAEEALDKTLEQYSRVQPADDFEQKLLQRLQRHPMPVAFAAQERGRWHVGWGWRLAALAAVVLMMAAGLAHYNGWRSSHAAPHRTTQSTPKPPLRALAANRPPAAAPAVTNRGRATPRRAQERIPHPRNYSAVFPTPFFPKALAEAWAHSGGQGETPLFEGKTGSEARPIDTEIKPLVIEPLSIPPLELAAGNTQAASQQENNP